MKLSLLSALFLPLLSTAQPAETDYYPQARAALLAAEKEAAKIADPGERADLLARISKDLATGGYLADAERAANASHISWAHAHLGLARIVYGDVDGGMTYAASLQNDPSSYARYLDRAASVLWRLHKPDLARKALDLADSAVKTLPAGPKRSALQQTLGFQREMLKDRADSDLSPKPSPPPAKNPTMLSQPFPVRKNGYVHGKLAVPLATSESFLNPIREALSAGKNIAAMQLAEAGATPWLRVLGLATVVDMTTRASNFEYAIRAATTIPRDHAEQSMARAEALQAVGASLTKRGERARAVSLLTEAAACAAETNVRLAPARVEVLTAIARELADSGAPVESKAAFQQALDTARALPAGPRPRVAPFVPGRYRSDGLRTVQSAQLSVRDVEGARATAAVWLSLERGEDADQFIGDWVEAEHVEEANKLAAAVPAGKLRADAYHDLGQTLLRNSGAPTI